MSSQKFKRSVRVSGLGDCQRRLAAQIFYPKDVPPREEKPVFTEGHWHEFEVKRRLGQDGVRFEYGATRVLRVQFQVTDNWIIKGHLDGLIVTPPAPTLHIPKSSRLILEVKGLGSGLFWKFVKGGYREALPGYFAQIQGYTDSSFDSIEPIDPKDPVAPMYPSLSEFEIEGGKEVPSEALVVVKHKESGNLRTEVVARDTGYLKDLRGLWTDALKMVEKGELPDRLYDDKENFECRECFFKDKCWGEAVTAVIPTTPPPDVLAAAEAYAIGKKISELGDTIMDSAKPLLSVGITGPLKVTQYTTHRKLWNYKRLEELLTPTQLEEVTVTKESQATRIDLLAQPEIKDVVKMLESGFAIRRLIEGGSDA